VIDEAEVLVHPTQGQGPDVHSILKTLGKRVQVLLFSATFPEEVRKFASQVAPNANRITVKKEDLTLSCVTQLKWKCHSDAQKMERLGQLYEAMTIGQSIIFVNSRERARQVAKMMVDEGHEVTLFTGTDKETMTYEMRDKILESFRAGVTKVLVSTPVLSRGVNVPAVTLVVNYDLPTMRFEDGARRQGPKVDPEDYIHRVGRTGRFGAKGIAINLLVTAEDERMMSDIEKHYQISIHECPEVRRPRCHAQPRPPPRAGVCVRDAAG